MGFFFYFTYRLFALGGVALLPQRRDALRLDEPSARGEQHPTPSFGTAQEPRGNAQIRGFFRFIFYFYKNFY